MSPRTTTTGNRGRSRPRALSDDGAPREGEEREKTYRGNRSLQTAQGAATRAKILDAALMLFADKGFHQTTVPDIVSAAGVGHGTFYKYFENRRDVLLELTKEAGEQGSWRPHDPSLSLADGIHREILFYLRDFARNIKLCKVWDEADAIDRDVRDARYKLREPQVARIRAAVEHLGTPGLDSAVAATALLAMLEEFTQRWLVELERPSGPRALESVARTLSNLWINAIGANTDPGRSSTRKKK